MKKFSKTAVILLMLVLFYIFEPSGIHSTLALEKSSEMPKTYLLLDVSGSTEDARNTLISLYKYLFKLFETYPYEMDLTICFFDKTLWTDNPYVVNIMVGAQNKTTDLSRLDSLFAEEDSMMFSRDTAVYDSLLTFDQMFIASLTNEEKTNTNIIVFSDMQSTIHLERNTDDAVNELFSKWHEDGITVKGLIWCESEENFDYQNSDDINRMYMLDLTNKIEAYECIFSIYFDILTGVQPENYDYNPQYQESAFVRVNPEAYEIFIISDSNDLKLVYINEEGDLQEIDTDDTELFPVENYPDSPPKVLVFNKTTVDKIGGAFSALNVSHFQVYQIVAPQISDVSLQQNGQNDLVRAGEPIEIVAKYNPQIRYWEQKVTELQAEMIIYQDDPDAATTLTLVNKKDSYEFFSNELLFSEPGEHHILIHIMDENGIIISEHDAIQYIAKEKEHVEHNTIIQEDDAPQQTKSKLPIILCICISLALLAVLLMFIWLKKPWM